MPETQGSQGPNSNPQLSSRSAPEQGHGAASASPHHPSLQCACLSWDAQCSPLLPHHHLTTRLHSTPPVLAELILTPAARGRRPWVAGSPGCMPSGPSVCGVSSVRDCSHLVTGSPSLPDKYRHAREMMLLLPTPRDRPSSAMYPAAILENGQVRSQPADRPLLRLCWPERPSLPPLGFLHCPCLPHAAVKTLLDGSSSECGDQHLYSVQTEYSYGQNGSRVGPTTVCVAICPSGQPPELLI